MKLQDLLPLAGMPPAGSPVNCVRLWFDSDSLEHSQNSDNRNYSEDSITYKFNSHGYRCPNFDRDAAIRMVSIGDALAFGLGVSQEQVFHERLAEQLRIELNTSVVNWNLSKPDASNDYTARTLRLALRELDPHMVIVLFSDIRGREGLTAENRGFQYRPGPHSGARFKESVNLLSLLENSFDNQLNFFKAYSSICSLLRDRLWFYSISSPEQIPAVAAHLDTSNQVIAPEAVDKGRDGQHPGPKTHDLMFGALWQRLVESDSLRSLPRHRQARRLPLRIEFQKNNGTHPIGLDGFAPVGESRERVSRRFFETCVQELVSLIDKTALPAVQQTYTSMHYDKYLTGIDAWIRSSVARALRLSLHRSPPLRILDIGSGPGYFMLACRYFGHAVAGIDLDNNPIFVALMREFRLRSFVHQIRALQALPNFGQRFDLITSIGVCFNQPLWGISEWDFFLNDLKAHASEEASFYMQLNPQKDGTLYSDDLKAYFLQRGEVKGKLVRIKLHQKVPLNMNLQTSSS